MSENKQNISCIGFIMDGNRRWAKERGLPTLEGHRKGYEKIKEVLDWMREPNIKNSILYAFSTENWNRTEKEVGYLMDLFRVMVQKEIESLLKEDIRVRFLGDISRFPEDLQKSMRELEEKTKDRKPYTLGLAMSYGGRAEIVHAANRAIATGEQVTEDSFSKLLWTHDIPDPDLIIRTSGEMRLSNFLPWQSVYAELFFVDTFWPAFEKEEFQSVLNEFNLRKRRKGE